MVKHRKKHTKTKVVYRERKESVDYDAKARKEIEEIEAKKAKALEGKKGLGKFFAGVGFNKEIYERKKLIGQGTQLQRLRKQAEIEKAKTEISKLRGERVNFNKKNAIDFGDLNKSSGIKFDDLYK